MQQFLTQLERVALQPVVIEQHDLLWRIKNFFRFNPEGGLDMGATFEEVPMNPSPTERDHGWTENKVGLVIDTTPALIHPALPEGSLDFFNQPLTT